MSTSPIEWHSRSGARKSAALSFTLCIGLATIASTFAVACSSEDTTAPADQTPSDAGGAPDPCACADCCGSTEGYPTDHIGWKARATDGTTPGDRIANLKFTGVRAGKRDTDTIELADFYDPQSKQHDALFIVCSVLDEDQGNETYKSLLMTSKRVATLSVVGYGFDAGTKATTEEFGAWVDAFPFATTVRDDDYGVFSQAFDKSALPAVLVVDTRTMEIAAIKTKEGFTGEGINTIVDAISKRAPAY